MTGFVCQCYLKEQRTPTGGLSEAGGVIGGGGGRVLCPRPLEWVEKTLEPRLLDFPLPGENDGYC